MAVSAAFLFAAVEPVRFVEIEPQGQLSGVYYSSDLNIASRLAISPKIGGNIVKNAFSPQRLGSLRLFILFGIYHILTAFSKSLIIRKSQSYPVKVKNSILLKLRI
ncbi:MAG: hypothetical protein LBO04_01535 [Spirochaetaceae bacterium]|nr:hypothetical protein [Spirochaetaceae bacterium]